MWCVCIRSFADVVSQREPADRHGHEAAEDTRAQWVSTAIGMLGACVHTHGAPLGLPVDCVRHRNALPYGLSVPSGSWWAAQLSLQGGGSATPFHVDVSRYCALL